MMKDEDSDRLRWDWVTFMLALVITVILGLLTFEFWASHVAISH